MYTTAFHCYEFKFILTGQVTCINIFHAHMYVHVQSDKRGFPIMLSNNSKKTYQNFLRVIQAINKQYLNVIFYKVLYVKTTIIHQVVID